MSVDRPDKAINVLEDVQVDLAHILVVDYIKHLESENDRQEDKLHKINQWAKAYSVDMFLEPDLKKAAELLKANGMTLDAVSSSNMRHVLTRLIEVTGPAG